MKKKLRHHLAYDLLGIASVLYIGITLLTPISSDSPSYGLSETAIHALQLSIVIPFIAIWFVALWGSLQFYNYAHKIEEGADGKALKWVAGGLLTLVGGLVMSTLVSSLRSYMLQHGRIEVWTILSNYIALAAALLAFAIISKGALKLSRLINNKGMRRSQVYVLTILALAGFLYGWLLGHDPYRSSTPDPAHYSSYFLPDWLLIITVVLPYLVVWYLGLISAFCIRLYQLYAPGIIYRRALGRLSLGLFAVIITSLLIQLLGALASSLGDLGLGALLLLIYVLILLYALGHVLVASGARRLSRIEEVK